MSPETVRRLDAVLPPLEPGNPVDILGNASPELYVAGGPRLHGSCPKSPGARHSFPQAMTDPTAWPEPWLRRSKNRPKPFMAVWMGARGRGIRGSECSMRLRIPTLRDSRRGTVDTFMEMYSYSRNLEILHETPPSLPYEIEGQYRPGANLHHRVSQAAREIALLTEIESKAILSAYGIAVNRTVDWHRARRRRPPRLPKSMGFPVAVKIYSPGYHP